MKKIFIFLIFCFVVFSCKISSPSEEHIESQISIDKILTFAPDRFNTGCNEKKLTEIKTGNHGTILVEGTDCDEPKNASTKASFFG